MVKNGVVRQSSSAGTDFVVLIFVLILTLTFCLVRFGFRHSASGIRASRRQVVFSLQADRVEFVDGISLENEIFVHNFFVPFIGWCKAAEIISAYITI